MILAYSLKRTSLIWQQERCQVDQTNLEQRSQCQKLSLERNEVNFFAFLPIIDKYREGPSLARLSNMAIIVFIGSLIGLGNLDNCFELGEKKIQQTKTLKPEKGKKEVK